MADLDDETIEDLDLETNLSDSMEIAIDTNTGTKATTLEILRKFIGVQSPINGLVLSYNSSSLVDISSGYCSAGAGSIELVSSITKDLSSLWVAGDGNGGLDVGSIANNTPYYAYGISNGSVDDVIFTASYGLPTLPSGYTISRFIGYCETDGSGNIRVFDYYKTEKNLEYSIFEKVAFNGVLNGSFQQFDLGSPSFKCKANISVYTGALTSGFVSSGIVKSDVGIEKTVASIDNDYAVDKNQGSLIMTATRQMYIRTQGETTDSGSVVLQSVEFER